jgi:hypothetical protein
MTTSTQVEQWLNAEYGALKTTRIKSWRDDIASASRAA